MSTKKSFVIVSSRDDHIRWVQSALADVGDVVVADMESLERILQIIDVTGAQIVFVDVNQEQITQQTSIIDGLLNIKPMISVVALSRSQDTDLVLAVMRAGARDFIVPGGDRGPMTSLVRRLGEQMPSMQSQHRDRGKMVLLANARPDSGTVMLALHLALAGRELSSRRKTLLLDLGMPQGDAMLYLGMKSSYSFVDAIRSLRRLDDTLIESAFSEHSSGLRILDMGKDASGIHNITSADVFILLGTLKMYFANIVVNVGGLPESEFLDVLLRHADRTIVLLEQSVPSVQQNMDLIKHMNAQKLDMERVSLVVDRYYAKLMPNAGVISKGFVLPMLATLPPCGLARLNVINSGMSMFEAAPKEPYVTQVRAMARQLFEAQPEVRQTAARNGLAGLWDGFRGLFRQEA